MGRESIRVTRWFAAPPRRDRAARFPLVRARRPARGTRPRPGSRPSSTSRPRRPSLPVQKRRVVARAGPVLRAVAQDGRTRRGTVELAVERVVAKLAEALRVERRRVPTRPTRARSRASAARRSAFARTSSATARSRTPSREPLLTRHKLLTADVVEPLLRGRFGRPYLWSESCTSTQDVLRGTDLPEGAVALTEHQTSGRGREGRPWRTSPGRRFSSRSSSGPCGHADPAAGARRRPRGRGGGRRAPRRRWDQVAERRSPRRGGRSAGVLLEASEGVVACGVGVNVSQDESELPARTRCPPGRYSPPTGRAPDRAVLLAALLEILEHRYDTWCRSGLAPLLDELEARNVLRGLQVEQVMWPGSPAHRPRRPADGRARRRDARSSEQRQCPGQSWTCGSRTGP